MAMQVSLGGCGCGCGCGRHAHHEAGLLTSLHVAHCAALLHSRHNVWSHVDAAYAGSAAVLPEQQHFFGGLQHVDSYSFNPHKWMLVNFDCCAMWVADQAPLKAALSLTPVFLQGQANILDYKDWQVPLGRRFRWGSRQGSVALWCCCSGQLLHDGAWCTGPAAVPAAWCDQQVPTQWHSSSAAALLMPTTPSEPIMTCCLACQGPPASVLVYPTSGE
jgi:hypothetical protein